MLINYNNRSNTLLIGIFIIIIILSSIFLFKKTEDTFSKYDRISFTCLKEDGIKGNRANELYKLCEQILQELFYELNPDIKNKNEYIAYLIEKRPSIYKEYKNGFMKSGKGYFNFYYKNLVKKEKFLNNIKKNIALNKFYLYEKLNKVFVSIFKFDDNEVNSDVLKLRYPYSILINYSFK